MSGCIMFDIMVRMVMIVMLLMVLSFFCLLIRGRKLIVMVSVFVVVVSMSVGIRNFGVSSL